MDIISAVINNDVEEVRHCLEQGISANHSEDKDHITPLHFAAQYNSVDVVTLLITAGANLYARSEPDGLSPLDIAKTSGHQEIMTILNRFLGQVYINDTQLN